MKKNIVIVGAGFGGITFALTLEKYLGACRENYQIILIDRHHHQLFTPALYEIAAIPHEYAKDRSLIKASIIGLSRILGKTRIQFLNDSCIGIDTAKNIILLRQHEPVHYDYGIFALGSETNYFDIPGLKEYSLPLKNSDDAVRLRNTIETALQQKEALAIVVGGAGPTGIELAAEFVNFICALKTKILPSRAICNATITLIEAAETILPGFDQWIIANAAKRLHHIGVRIMTRTAVIRLDRAVAILGDGRQEPFDIFIWTGGVRGPALLETFDFPLSSKKTLIVDDYLRINGIKNLYAIGDNAAYTDPRTARLLPWNIPVAEHQGRFVAQTIWNEIQNRPVAPFQPMKKYPFVLAMGKKYALADFIILRITGRLGWFIKCIIELRYFLFILPLHVAFRTWWTNVKLYRSND